jgi:hypothetical protein
MGDVMDARMNGFDVVMEMGGVERGPPNCPGQLLSTMGSELTLFSRAKGWREMVPGFFVGR